MLPTAAPQRFKPNLMCEGTLHHQVVDRFHVLAAKDAVDGRTDAMLMQTLSCPAPIQHNQPDEEAEVVRGSSLPQLFGAKN
jgi:hypothetical protein